MGNFEKLVVLTVLFLSAIVLAVSLSSDDETQAGMTPFDDAALQANRGTEPAEGNDHLTMTAEGVRRDDPAAPKAGTGQPVIPVKDPSGSKPDPVLEEPGFEDSAVTTNAMGHPRVLRSRMGLTSSPLEDYMVYTPGKNDTWSSLSDRFYRSSTYVSLLRAANEDLERPVPGEAILVPVFDFRIASANRAPREAAPARALTPEVETPTIDAIARPGATSTASNYTVVDGDNLWKIADKVYGSGARWMEIYEANKNVMSDPDALQIGMELRVPR